MLPAIVANGWCYVLVFALKKLSRLPKKFTGKLKYSTCYRQYFFKHFKLNNMTLNEWIVFGHVGMSSKTMWAVVTGTLNPDNIKKYRVKIPYDKDDFSRCYTLWKECKLSDIDLRKIKETCPIWKPFIDNWHELVRRYENNEKMYEYMSELVEQGQLNAGWIKTSPNSWKLPS